MYSSACFLRTTTNKHESTVDLYCTLLLRTRTSWLASFPTDVYRESAWERGHRPTSRPSACQEVTSWTHRGYNLSSLSHLQVVRNKAGVHCSPGSSNYTRRHTVCEIRVQIWSVNNINLVDYPYSLVPTGPKFEWPL